MGQSLECLDNALAQVVLHRHYQASLYLCCSTNKGQQNQTHKGKRVMLQHFIMCFHGFCSNPTHESFLLLVFMTQPAFFTISSYKQPHGSTTHHIHACESNNA